MLEAIAASLDGADCRSSSNWLRRDPSAVRLLRASARSTTWSTGSPGHAALDLVRRVEERTREGGGVVYLIEEPELYLRPPTRSGVCTDSFTIWRTPGTRSSTRHTRRRFSTSPAWRSSSSFGRTASGARKSISPGPLPWSDEVSSSWSTIRRRTVKLFLARGALLVEETEEARVPVRLPEARPRRGRGVDLDIECGGKSRIVLLARVCDLCRIPFVAVHDGDTRPGAASRFRPSVRSTS